MIDIIMVVALLWIVFVVNGIYSRIVDIYEILDEAAKRNEEEEEA